MQLINKFEAHEKCITFVKIFSLYTAPQTCNIKQVYGLQAPFSGINVTGYMGRVNGAEYRCTGHDQVKTGLDCDEYYQWACCSRIHSQPIKLPLFILFKSSQSTLLLTSTHRFCIAILYGVYCHSNVAFVSQGNV